MEYMRKYCSATSSSQAAVASPKEGSDESPQVFSFESDEDDEDFKADEEHSVFKFIFFALHFIVR